jgi:hypothetical protein
VRNLRDLALAVLLALVSITAMTCTAALLGGD